jgi:hypothetical protein
MRRKSLKQQQLERETHAIRRSNIEFGVDCEACGSSHATDRHEIPAGSYRRAALSQPHAQMDLCRACHDETQGAPPGEQIAIKAVGAIAAVNRCYGSNRVSISDVIKALKELEKHHA